ncbi:hypothetical protein HK100_009208, partial [Physocladia obscura]
MNYTLQTILVAVIRKNTGQTAPHIAAEIANYIIANVAVVDTYPISFTCASDVMLWGYREWIHIGGSEKHAENCFRIPAKRGIWHVRLVAGCADDCGFGDDCDDTVEKFAGFVFHHCETDPQTVVRKKKPESQKIRVEKFERQDWHE